MVRYRARLGDTLESIADEFDVTIAELKKWNGLRSNRVVRGRQLKIYPGGKTPPPAANSAARSTASAAVARQAAPPTSAPGQTVSYHVRPGETLWSIARAYQTTVEALRAANQYLFSRPLQAGDTLIILPSR